MTEYTVVLIYEWNKYGEGLKKIFKRFGVKWNSSKTKKLNEEELKDIEIKFKIENDTDWRNGKSGIWESKDCAIKVVMGDINDIALLIYRKRSLEDKVWKDFIQYCKNSGALVQLLDENMEVIFRDRINIELIDRINDKEGEKKVMIENFIMKVSNVDDCILSNSFKGEWIRCVENSRNERI